MLTGKQHKALHPPMLLADATWYGTLAAVRNLAAHGAAVTLASDSWVAPARWSRHAARTISCPSSKNPTRFLPWLLRFGEREPGHVLYPTSDEVAWLIALHFEALAHTFRLYSPPIEALVRLLDKARLIEDARASGLETPESIVPRSQSELERAGGELGFPVYVKPRAQVYARSAGKGVRVYESAALFPTWLAQLNTVKYDAEILKIIPDVCFPMIQTCISGTERVYTVDGFIDETGELFTARACVKVLQRPRGSGPGIIFEAAELNPNIAYGLRRLFQQIGFFGVFDAEFMEFGDRRLLIDLNPRFYNHMAFEIARGLHLPWLAYLAAIGDKTALRLEIEKANAASFAPSAYIHGLSTNLLLTAQRFAGAMSRNEQLRWQTWISEKYTFATDPAHTVDDPAPRVAEIAMEVVAFLQHPRAYLGGLKSSPN